MLIPIAKVGQCQTLISVYKKEVSLFGVGVGTDEVHSLISVQKHWYHYVCMEPGNAKARSCIL